MQQLRPYQANAIEALRNSIRKGNKRIVLVAPTGAGKTTIAASMIEAASSKGKSILFLAHRIELINQCSTRLEQFGVDHGVIQADHPKTDASKNVQVCSVPTLAARMRRNVPLPPADLIFVDEAHRILAQSYLDSLASYGKAVVVGLTATPWRSDKQGLGDFFSDLVLVATPRELIVDGYLLQPRIFAGPKPELSGVGRRHGDYVEHDLALAMNSRVLVGKATEHWLKMAKGKRTLVFCVNIDHALNVTDAFSECGARAQHINANTPADERAATLEALAAGAIDIVTNVGILT